MAKSKQQKQKDRERRVAKKKLEETAKRRETAKKTDDTSTTGAPRGKKVITAGVRQQQGQSQVQSGKPTVAHRRAGG